jgi:hypothetical protein
MTKQFDSRIIAALSDSIASEALAALIADIEQALSDAIAVAADTVRRSMDPLDVLDANVARASVEIANFRVHRLEGALRCLTNKFYDTKAKETRSELATL